MTGESNDRRNLYAYLLLVVFVFLGAAFNVKNYFCVEKDKPIEKPIVKIVVDVPSVLNPYPLITTAKRNSSLNIAIVIVIANDTNIEDYKTSLNSLECYSALHGYELRVEKDNKFEECSKHRDNSFKRHCHMHQIMMSKVSQEDWFLFIDADVGVVNPNKFIEDFIEPGYDIYLYNRFYNWEIAPQYLIKNNERSRNWVKQLADMEIKASSMLPKSHHGSDSDALHILMMEYLIPETKDRNSSRLSRRCFSMWEQAINDSDLLSMRACTKMVIGERIHFPEQRVKLFPTGKGWARDMRVLKSHWAIDDFMVESIKEENLKPEAVKAHNLAPHFGDLQNPLHSELISTTAAKQLLAFPVLKRLNVSQCKIGKEDWIMDNRFRITDALREKLFNRMSMMTLKEQYLHFGQEFNKFPLN